MFNEGNNTMKFFLELGSFSAKIKVLALID